jgi:PAS domain S-box-containing protein
MTDEHRSNTEPPKQALLEANALLRTVIDENPNIIMMKDWDGRFLLGNRALAKLYGTTPEALVGQDDSAFNPNAEQVAFYLQNVRDVMSQDQTQVVMETSTNATTGETAYFQSIKVPLTTPEGKKQILVIANDVTELKRTQQKLEISERRLRYVLEATGEGIWDWDIASDVVTHNRRWCEIAGLDDDFLQHPLAAFIDLLHEEDAPAVVARVQACLSGDGRYESEHRLRLGDGRVVWVHDRGAVVERDAQGQPLRVVGSLVDISARKASEQAAQRANQLLREAVDNIAIGFSMYDEQDRLYLCNEAYKRIYKDNPLIVPGNSFEHIVHHGAERKRYLAAEDDIEAWVRQRVAQHQQASGELMEQQLADGRWLLVVESRTPSGFVVGNRIDITERKKTEALVLEHAEQLKTIFDLSPDGFVTFDREHRVKSLNPAFGRLTGLDGAALVGLDEHRFSEALAQRCEPQAVFPGLSVLREKKRAIFGQAPGQANSPMAGVQRQLIELSGPVARVLEVRLRLSTLPDVSQILYVRDVTHEAEVERLKSKFMSMAAHELRNPMASIYGFTEILNTHDLSEDERKEFLEIIYNQSEHMMAILNELLDLARIEARRGRDFVFEPVSVQALVDGVVQQFKLPEGRTPPQVQAPDEPLFVLADQRKAAQAVHNVLSNAYKYSTGPVRITLEPQGDGVAVAVQDQGTGMTPAEIKLVGTPFYRSDTSGRVLGTGLGLSIVKEIMKLHQGRMDIDSTPGKGTRVGLLFCTNRYFPVVQEAP